ncbi:hypothetical protein AMTRI_Chr02g256030 [Amborella trichopoda]
MPAQKRSVSPDSPPMEHNSDDSQESPSSSGDKDEKTRTVMECLHRFCRECIDKSMRLGNNECPACRTHCPSRRSLRDDPNYDTLIAAIYPDVDKYEEEELAFHEEEKSRNKQIQATIAQTFRRQSEAYVKRKSSAKATAAAFVRKANYRNSRRKNRSGPDSSNAGSDDADEETNGNEGAKDSSSADEPSPEVRHKRCRRWAGTRTSHGSTNIDGGSNENEDNNVEASRESSGASPCIGGNPEKLSWGKGGVRSHTRYGSVSGSYEKNQRNRRIARIMDYFFNKSMEENEDEFDIHLTLVPWDEESIPSLQRPYICCRPTVTVNYLCQYIAVETSVKAEDLELMVRKSRDGMLSDCLSQPDPSTSADQNPRPSENENLQILPTQETLAGLHACYPCSRGDLVLIYRQKSTNPIE